MYDGHVHQTYALCDVVASHDLVCVGKVNDDQLVSFVKEVVVGELACRGDVLERAVQLANNQPN